MIVESNSGAADARATVYFLYDRQTDRQTINEIAMTVAVLK